MPWALAKVKSDMDAKAKNADHQSTPWTTEALRKQWNQEKDELAPLTGLGGEKTPKKRTRPELQI